MKIVFWLTIICVRLTPMESAKFKRDDYATSLLDQCLPRFRGRYIAATTQAYGSCLFAAASTLIAGMPHMKVELHNAGFWSCLSYSIFVIYYDTRILLFMHCCLSQDCWYGVQSGFWKWYNLPHACLCEKNLLRNYQTWHLHSWVFSLPAVQRGGRAGWKLKIL